MTLDPGRQAVLQRLLEPLARKAPEWHLQDATSGQRLRLLFARKSPQTGQTLSNSGSGNVDPASLADIWIAAADSKQPAYKTTLHFLVGHAGKLSGPAIRFLDLFCAVLVATERELTSTQVRTLLAPPETTSLLGRDLELRITRRCNEACPFCSAKGWADNRITNSEQILASITQAKSSGAQRVVFSGGEPSLVPELPSLVSFARSLGLATVIQTNGLVPSHPAWWQKFCSSQGTWDLPDSIFLSLHSQFQRRMLALTGVPNTLHRKLASARNAHRLNVGVAINFVITHLNLDELPDFPRFIAARLGRYPELVLSVAAPVGGMEDSLDLLVSITELAQPLAKALRGARSLALRTQVAEACGVPMCTAPDLAEHFAAFHRSQPIGPLASDRIKAPSCADCRYDSRCIGVWTAYANRFGLEELKPVRR